MILDLDAKGISNDDASVISEKFCREIIVIIESDEYLKSGNDIYAVVLQSEIEDVIKQYEKHYANNGSDDEVLEFGKIPRVKRIVIGK